MKPPGVLTGSRLAASVAWGAEAPLHGHGGHHLPRAAEYARVQREDHRQPRGALQPWTAEPP